ncbi:MAG: hypothetical protein ACRC32_13905 [Chroococcidiopsis sp.]
MGADRTHGFDIDEKISQKSGVGSRESGKGGKGDKGEGEKILPCVLPHFPQFPHFPHFTHRSLTSHLLIDVILDLTD